MTFSGGVRWFYNERDRMVDLGDDWNERKDKTKGSRVEVKNYATA